MRPSIHKVGTRTTCIVGRLQSIRYNVIRWSRSYCLSSLILDPLTVQIIAASYSDFSIPRLSEWILRGSSKNVLTNGRSRHWRQGSGQAKLVFIKSKRGKGEKKQLTVRRLGAERKRKEIAYQGRRERVSSAKVCVGDGCRKTLPRQDSVIGYSLMSIEPRVLFSLPLLPLWIFSYLFLTSIFFHLYLISVSFPQLPFSLCK